MRVKIYTEKRDGKPKLCLAVGRDGKFTEATWVEVPVAKDGTVTANDLMTALAILKDNVAHKLKTDWAA